MDKKAASWQDYLEHAELSDVGLRRSNNQDSFGTVISSSEDVWRRRGHLFMVADGMGAHAAGELASKMAVDNVLLTHYKFPDGSASKALKTAIEEANAKIHARGQANPDFKGMGTTTTALGILPQGAIVGHVGDSRCYRLRGNRIEQLSADHSLVWEMMAASKITERELPNYVPKNVITRSLGPNEAVQVDVEGPFPLMAGDTFLLCSDGLSGQVNDDEIGVILQALPPSEAVQTLVDLANLRGGPDNITVIVTRVAGVPDGSASAGNGSSGSGAGRSIDPAFSLVFGVAALAGAALFFAGEPWYALACGGVALASRVGMLFQGSGGSSDGDALAAEGVVGKGPYRSQVCAADADFLDRLDRLIEPIRQSATEQNWQIDWPEVDQFRVRSAAAAERGDYLQAARELCRALSFLMQEVREQRRKKSAV